MQNLNEEPRSHEILTIVIDQVKYVQHELQSQMYITSPQQPSNQHSKMSETWKNKFIGKVVIRNKYKLQILVTQTQNPQGAGWCGTQHSKIDLISHKHISSKSFA